MTQQSKSSNVYVVHGNDVVFPGQCYQFLKALNLQPITEEKAALSTNSTAPFVGDVIDKAFEHAQAIIVLFTGDEPVRLKSNLWKHNEEQYEKEFCLQPTLDQLFLAGYAFGRSAERTILLQTNNVRPFSDIAGRFILHFSADKALYLDLARRLRIAGCALRTNRDLLGEIGLNSELFDEFINLSDNTPSPDQTVTNNSQKENSNVNSNRRDPREVFVIHGRNKCAKNALFALLKALGLSPISWDEAVRSTNIGAPYIGQVLDAQLRKAQAVVVLLTGDDETEQLNIGLEAGKVKQDVRIARFPRPNVVFEAGMAFSNQDLAQKTILVEVGSVQIWRSLAGRHRIKLTNKIEDRLELAQSLLNAGCTVIEPTIPKDYETLRKAGNFNCD